MSSKTTTTGRAFLALCREWGAVFDSAELGFHGFHPLPARGRPVTNELFNRLRDEPASTVPWA